MLLDDLASKTPQKHSMSSKLADELCQLQYV